jgi:hypothetical protein
LPGAPIADADLYQSLHPLLHDAHVLLRVMAARRPLLAECAAMGEVAAYLHEGLARLERWQQTREQHGAPSGCCCGSGVPRLGVESDPETQEIPIAQQHTRR